MKETWSDMYLPWVCVWVAIAGAHGGRLFIPSAKYRAKLEGWALLAGPRSNKTSRTCSDTAVTGRVVYGVCWALRTVEGRAIVVPRSVSPKERLFCLCSDVKSPWTSRRKNDSLRASAVQQKKREVLPGQIRLFVCSICCVEEDGSDDLDSAATKESQKQGTCLAFVFEYM
eukprot:scaffold10310_cov171-Amphora_coffeaeformis.AAC.10